MQAMSTAAVKRDLSRARGGKDQSAPKRGRGRPTDYEPWMLVRAAQLGASGMIDTEICQELGISIQTLYRWKAERPDFREAINQGKWLIDERIEGSLVARAMGGIKRTTVHNPDGTQTVKIEELPGSDRAALALLYSRGRLKPPRTSHELVVPVETEVQPMSEEETDARKLALSVLAILREAEDAPPLLEDVSYDANDDEEPDDDDEAQEDDDLDI